MTDTLPTIAGHSLGDVLRFWFEELSPKQHFNASPELDRRIAERFGTLTEALEAAGYPHVWEGTPEGALALVIALDQFPRNIHRSEAGAYLSDTIALDVAMRLIGNGYLEELPEDQRKFALMPLMHSEDPEVQKKSVEMFAELGDADTLRHAEAHRRVVELYGRFPGRNAVLGRESTPGEEAYLENGGYAALLREAETP